MDIVTVFEGVHPDGMKFRVRRIDNMFYYAVQIKDDYEGWIWHTVARHPSQVAIVGMVKADRVAKQKRIDMLKERG